MKLKSIYLILLICVLSTISFTKQDDICVYKFESNKYDLTELFKSGALVLNDAKSSKTTYSVDPCAPVACSPTESPMCQKDDNGSLHSCGILSSATSKEIENGGGVEIDYSGGDGGRASTVSVYCDPLAETPTYDSVNEAPTKTYNAVIRSKYGCPSTGGDGGLGGWVFIIILVVVIVIYIIGGILFMRFAKGATGSDMIPNKEFWVDFPSLLKDGFFFMFSCCRKSDYDAV
eukprot:TRINITY_DN312_c0_g2_i1.p1 TRINITY_DN312_c0_g2~~TRINITY_DN312_c0_g2_i1.p1  ORF type:complete len:232 (-),score=76.90 TRINITY_DN312_c0_g2_i1:401-1096(-)